MKLYLTILTLLLLAPSAFGEDDTKIDNVGPIKKVGPIEKVGPIAPIENGPTKTTPPSPTSGDQKTTPGGGSFVTAPPEFVDIKTAPGTAASGQPPEKSAAEQGLEALENFVGGHRKGASEGENSDSGSSGSGQSLFGPAPNLMELGIKAPENPIQVPKRDAPEGYVKIEIPEKPSKDPRKDFPAGAGGSGG